MMACGSAFATEPYHSGLREPWDQLVGAADGGTTLHSRNFLDYHGDRFRDLSTVLYDKNGGLAGVFPIVEHPRNPKAAVSHAGSSFGGVVTRSRDIVPKWLRSLIPQAPGLPWVVTRAGV